MYKQPRTRLPLRILSLVLVFFAFSFGKTSAQNVSGTVTDDQGKPLPNVSVLVKGSQVGTTSDNAGKFTVNDGANKTLVFSHIGFQDQEIATGTRSTINVSMALNLTSDETVVVTALGIKREARKLGYAAETVKMNEIQQNRTNNLAAGLEGKIAGLNISPPSAGAGASTKIRLRGQASFAGGENGPLLVINGLPMSQGARGANGTGNQTDDGDNLMLINPDDIESMTVLKGSTAAALYGARAANGAIIITTKNGSKNTGLGVEITSSYNAEQAIDLTDFQYEYGQGQGGQKPTTYLQAQQNGQFGFGARYDGSLTPQFDGVDRPYSPNKNRVSDFFRIANTFTNSVALSGGNGKGSFRASYTNQRAEGIVPNNSYKKHIANLGVNYNLSEALNVSLNVNYTHEDSDNPPFVGSQGPSVINFLYRVSPVIPLSAFEENAVDENNNERRTTNFNTTILNPYYDMARRFNYTKRDRLLTTATVRYDITKWLYAQGRVNMDFSTRINEFNTPTGSGAVSNATYVNGTNNQAYTGSYTVNSGANRQLNMDFLIGSNQKYGDFSVDLSVGGNTFVYYDRGSGQSANGFVVRDLYTIQNGYPENRINAANNYGITKSQINSLYGFADFGYKNYLYINLTGREDWYSVLNPQNNHYFYPSASASLIFSEFTKGSMNWLNYGKLRGGVSVVGNTNGVNPYEGQLNYGIGSFGGYLLGNLPGNNPNPNLKPYSTTETEIGLELKTLGNRLNLDLSWYNRITKDQIVTVGNSIASGYGGRKVNYGKLRNRGFEVLLEGVPISTRNFTWTSSVNNGYNITKVLALAPGLDRSYVAQFNDGAELFGAISNVVGKEMNQITGRTYLRNANGEILVTNTGRLRGTSNDTIFGSALPKWTGGWNNIFRYKNLSLLVHIDWKFGGKMLSGTALNGLRQGHSKASLVGRREGENGIIFPGVYDDGKENTTAVTDLQGFYGDYRSRNLLDPFVFRSDFIKLRNITLTYDFSSLMVSRVKFVKGLTLSVSCRNVAIIKKWVPDIDPESVASSGDFRVGYEQSSLPTTRNYGVNLNVKF